MLDLSTHAAQIAHYASVQARLGKTSVAAVVRLPPKPAPILEPPCRKRRAPRDVLIIRTNYSGKHSSQGGIWNRLLADQIIDQSAEKHGVFVSQMKGQGRPQPVVNARFEAYYRLSTELGYSLPMIGKAMGNKEHTGVMHGIRRYKERMGTAGI